MNVYPNAIPRSELSSLVPKIDGDKRALAGVELQGGGGWTWNALA